MTSLLSSFQNEAAVAVIGASGGIGTAICQDLAAENRVNTIYAFSRSKLRFSHPKIIAKHIELLDESSISDAAASIQQHKLTLILVTTGVLHDQDKFMPEKSIRDLSQQQLTQLFAINTIGPALVAKYFMPLLNHTSKSVFAALSARVGSISDNRLGGWHSYRASKAALNMLLKNFALEQSRRHQQQIIIGLHPGTVDSALSSPFQTHVPEGKLFSAQEASQKLLTVINEVKQEQSGSILAWDGSTIAP